VDRAGDERKEADRDRCGGQRCDAESSGQRQSERTHEPHECAGNRHQPGGARKIRYGVRIGFAG
jgi:hypothetical protein